MNTRPQEYVDRYIEKNYVLRDPVVTELRNTLNPYTWGDVRVRRDLSKDEKAIIDEAAGIRRPGRAGHRPDCDVFRFGNFSFSALVAASRTSAIAPEPRWRSSASIPSTRSSARSFAPCARRCPTARLTPRELEILRRCKDGKTHAPQIGEILSISPRPSNSTCAASWTSLAPATRSRPWSLLRFSEGCSALIPRTWAEAIVTSLSTAVLQSPERRRPEMAT